jgi:hypothetical protein
VNWLEIEAASQFMAHERAEEIARNKHHYRWMYRAVLSDWRGLEKILCEYLHEQMHWYEDRLGCAGEGSPLITELMLMLLAINVFLALISHVRE